MALNKKILAPAIISAVVFAIIAAFALLSGNHGGTIDSNTTDGFNQTAMLERGDVAMGFNQTMIHHHFMSTSTGGQIMIMSANASDIRTVSEIRDHVRDIQYEFSQGNFTKPFYIHAQQVPGTDVMAERKNLIRYTIRDIEGGSVLILTTNDTKLVGAIQQFMDFQSSQHMGH